MPPLVKELFGLTPELQELDDLLHDLESWQDAEGVAKSADRLAKEAAERRVEELLAKVGPRVDELGEALHAWACRAQADAVSAKAELARVKHMEAVKRRRLARVKDLALRFLAEAGLQRLQGPTWRLRRQANGGRPPIEHDGVTPVPIGVAAPILVSPGLLLALLRQVDSRYESMSPNEALSRALNCDIALQPSIERVQGVIQETGVVPDGFTVQPRGEHLRVE